MLQFVIVSNRLAKIKKMKCTKTILHIILYCWNT